MNDAEKVRLTWRPLAGWGIDLTVRLGVCILVNKITGGQWPVAISVTSFAHLTPYTAAILVGEGMSMKLKVLVTDDERVIADTLALILNKSGFEATAVYSGEDAIKIARTFQPDVLFSDVVMPGLNGVDAAIEIRKILPTCKILLLSGENSTADLLEEASRQGHDFEIVAKPIPPSVLLARLEELISNSDETGLAS